MARRSRVTVCSHCIGEFPDKEMYVVERLMHKGDATKGIYRTPYCEKCLKHEDTYVKIHKKPKGK